MIDVREESMINGETEDIPIPNNIEDDTITLLFSETIGAGHIIKCNGINNVLDPVSGKRSYKIVAQLCDKNNLSKPLGEKSFFWPENDIPNFKIEQKPKLLLITKGKNNIAELPFKLPKNSFFNILSTNKITRTGNIKSSFTGSIQNVENTNSLLTNTKEFINKSDEEKWMNLVKYCSSDENTNTKSFITADVLSEDDQIKLFDLFLQKIKTKQQEGQVLMVFNVLLKNKIFSTNIFSEIVKKLIEINNFKLLYAFIKSPQTIVMDDEYIAVIKFIIESKDEQCCDMFMNLISKGFTIGTIRQKFANELTSKETIEILNWCINILDQNADDEYICQILLDLMLVLLDSQCDKLVMDDECYSSLKRAKDYVQSMTEITTAFTRLLSKNKAKTEIPELEASADTDFIIEKVKFVKKKLL